MSSDVQQVQTARLRTGVRLAGDPTAPAVVLIHGNVSSSVFFVHLIAELARDRYVVAPDFRGYGDSERLPIDATRGMADLSDDVAALLDELGLTGPVDVLGWSAGGTVALQLAIDHPGRVRRLVLEAPGSPFGFGGSTGTDGRPVADDFAGSGGGTANPQFCQALAAGARTPPARGAPCARSTSSPGSPSTGPTRRPTWTGCWPPASARTSTPVTCGPARTGPGWRRVSPG
jgi:pimeloyl-ACP methyl ester carboxylesterase